MIAGWPVRLNGHATNLLTNQRRARRQQSALLMAKCAEKWAQSSGGASIDHSHKDVQQRCPRRRWGNAALLRKTQTNEWSDEPTGRRPTL